MAKFDLHQNITDGIIAAIEEKGTLPWVRPWTSAGRPRNGISQKPYSGINHLLLSIAGAQFGSQEWFTFNQARDAGGTVKKGSVGYKIVFWNIIKKEDAMGGEETFPLLRYFTVFNRDQIDGLPAPKVAERSFTPLDEVESFVAATGASIAHGGDRAFYSLATDSITLPNRTSFVSETAYYATLFHELVHWTGHKSRLDRPLANRFGSPEYAEEELVAELGAAFLCAECGVDGQTQHPEYIASWLTALKNDKRFIFKAASAAKKAVGFVKVDEALTGEAE
jgi:antirestriction protein ArdC